MNKKKKTINIVTNKNQRKTGIIQNIFYFCETKVFTELNINNSLF